MKGEGISGNAICPNCGAPITGKWCANCGQTAILGRGSFTYLVQHQWTRIRHTLVALVIHPGQLTADFRDGKRARSINPWRLTFNVIAVFFALSFVTDFKVATFPKFDPSGTVAEAMTAAAKQARVDKATFIERVDRRFNVIYTAMVLVGIAVSAGVAALSHWRQRKSWGVHFVFALHLTAFSFIANAVFDLALRWFGLDSYMMTTNVQIFAMGLTLLSAIEVWSIAYVALAFRRVYADGWMSGTAKAVIMVFVRLVVGNATLFLALWLSMQLVMRF